MSLADLTGLARVIEVSSATEHGIWNPGGVMIQHAASNKETCMHINRHTLSPGSTHTAPHIPTTHIFASCLPKA